MFSLGSLSKAAQNFIEYQRNLKQASSHTIENYSRDIFQFETFLEKAASQAKREDVLGFMTELHEMGVSTATSRRKLSTLKSFYKFQSKHHGLEQDPTSGVLYKKLERKLPNLIYLGDIKRILKALEEPEDYAGWRLWVIVEMFYGLGIRLSELTGICLEKIRLADKSVLVLGKGGKTRYLPLTDRLVRILIDYIKVRESFLEEKVKARQKSEYLLLNLRGNPLTGRGVQLILNEGLDRLCEGFKIHPHAFRHSYATHLLDQGADIRVVQSLLGHSSLSATQIYTHLSISKLRETYLSAHPLVKERV